jgi:DNA-binding winged helix-turn-helix (wHTH) protein/cytochrome c-type biogenesis protein CcmH/NrfG
VSSDAVYEFGPFQLDARSNQLTRAGERVTIGDRHVSVLKQLVANAGSTVSKDALIAAAWEGVAVTDNSLEQVISALRRLLGGAEGKPYLETVPRRGYRFAGEVSRVVRRESDQALEALLAPHRAWIEGRAALETLERDQIAPARDLFESVLRSAPDQASAHVGLANACLMQFETTRADESPDEAALAKAAHHAREACRLDAAYAEAWATLGFILGQSGSSVDALAASRRAVTLEPDNWRHHFRLAFVGWGEERLREARRTLALLPGFPLAHWLAATVHVARQALVEAERELAAGIAGQDGQDVGQSRFSGVALHWLLGLIRLHFGDHDRALEQFERELSFEGSGHLYARECCANTWYAIGALRLREGRLADARDAFSRAIDRVGIHPTARVGLAAVSPDARRAADQAIGGERMPRPLEAAMVGASQLVLAGAHDDAARLVDTMLAGAPPGNAGWLTPIEPLLNVSAHPAAWAPVLARLRTRAA